MEVRKYYHLPVDGEVIAVDAEEMEEMPEEIEENEMEEIESENIEE